VEIYLRHPSSQVAWLTVTKALEVKVFSIDSVVSVAKRQHRSIAKYQKNRWNWEAKFQIFLWQDEAKMIKYIMCKFKNRKDKAIDILYMSQHDYITTQSKVILKGLYSEQREKTKTNVIELQM